MWLLKKIISFPVLVLIKFYQWCISPLTPGSCRFSPTCSHYSYKAIKEWGVLKGGWLSLKRISKCHPWGGQGYDPVPERKSRKSE